MASKFARETGYEEDLFVSTVSENFKCAICLNVLKNPKSCQNNQHYFCCGCITEHLRNFHRCPECMEQLTLETLGTPPRVLLNCISELRIKCGYHTRGCPEHVQLGSLQKHNEHCGYAPVLCENDGCGMEVNSQDKVRHETELCKFRKVECYGCGELKRELEKMRKNQEKLSRDVDEMQKEMESQLNARQKKMESQLSSIKEGVKETFKYSLDKIECLFSPKSQNYPQPTPDAQAMKQSVFLPPQQVAPPINHDVIVIGGQIRNGITGSVEKYSGKEGRWVDLAPLLVPRHSASSVVYGNQIIVSGGYTDKCKFDNRSSSEATDSVEILNLDQLPLKWVLSDLRLPRPLARHHTFVYNGVLIVVCQYYAEGEGSGRKIFEVHLAPPYFTYELSMLPDFHRRTIFAAELVKEKIFIFEGEELLRNNVPTNVYVYDLVKNECLEMPGLRVPRWKMSTVNWRDQIILLGGTKKVEKDSRFHTEVSDDVIVYDTETGESAMLPAMNHPRAGLFTVITDEVIITMGGHYNSVEFFDFSTSAWKALPAMKAIRRDATAVVSPV